MDPPLSIRPYDLRQLTYCERKVFYLHVASLPQRETWNMQAGQVLHEESLLLVGMKALADRGMAGWQRLKGFEIEAPKIGLRGTLDLAFTDGETIIPAEFKSLAQRPEPAHRLQLCAYALALEEVTGRPVPFGLWIGQSRLSALDVQFDARLRGRTRKAIQRVRQIMINEEFPPAPADTQRCTGCEFRNFCGDTD